MDATPPPPAYVYAPGDLYPRGRVEQDLCARASSPDYVYLGGAVAATAGAIAADTALRSADAPLVRLSGPALVGLTWGFFVGSIYPSLPKCSPTWVESAPAEGWVRASWPIAVSMGLIATVTAPVVVGIETGSVPLAWTNPERAARVFIPVVTGAIGAVLPYLLPPKTWRAGQELRRLRFGATSAGGFITYAASF